MKLEEVIRILEAESHQSDELDILLLALRKHKSVRVGMFAEKVRSMRMPKVDPQRAVEKLNRVFQDTNSFDEYLNKMSSDRDYTKAILIQIFRSLFPRVKAPAQSSTKAKIIQKLREQRIRAENYATA